MLHSLLAIGLILVGFGCALLVSYVRDPHVIALHRATRTNERTLHAAIARATRRERVG
jgi:hypothetical protein